MDMKLSRRSLLASAAVGAGAIATGQFAATKAFAAKPLKICSVITRLENDYFTDWNKGCQQAAKALGIDYSILSYEGQAAKQIEIIQTQLQAGARAFFGDANDTANVRAITQMLKGTGAIYIAVWDTLPWMHPLDQGPSYGTYFTAYDVVNAYNLSKVLFTAMGGKGNLVHVTGFPGASPDIARTIGVDKALKEFPGIKVVVRQPGNWNPQDARKVMADAIVSQGGKIDGVYAQNDSEGLGIMQALDEAGIKVPVVGHDGNADNLTMIAEGRYLASISYMPQYQGAYALIRAHDILNGWKPTPTELMMATGGTLVTKDNVGKLKDFLGKESLAFDWKKMSRVLHPDDWDPQNVVWPLNPAELWDAYPKPAGYKLPAEYLAAESKGDLQAITKLYADHYKAKLPF